MALIEGDTVIYIYGYGERHPALRAPGAHARAIVLRLRLRTLMALGALAIGTGLMGRSFGLRSPIFMGSEVALLAFILVVYRYLLPLVDRHDRGAQGEELVGGLLDTLPQPQWLVLHDVQLGRGNVDHIAIGPPGVFTVETKSHPGPIAVGRLHGRLLRQANAQRRNVARCLAEAASGQQRAAAAARAREQEQQQRRRARDAENQGGGLPAEGAATDASAGVHAEAAAADVPAEPVPMEALVVYSRAWVDRPLARRKGVRVLPAGMMTRYLGQLPERIEPSRRKAIHAELLAAAMGDTVRHGEQHRDRIERDA